MPSVKHYSSSEVNQYELSSRLLSLTENNTSYTLTQINGQRIYRKAPHAWSGPEPSRNCEVIFFICMFKYYRSNLYLPAIATVVAICKAFLSYFQIYLIF